MTTDFRFGIMLAPQATTWPAMVAAAERVDRLGYDHLWTWDHLHAILGDPEVPIFEGYAILAGWAVATKRVGLGLLVGANPFRNPGVVAKAIATLDHVSGGRAIAGLGAAWFDDEHRAHGLDFGASVGERLGWLEESASAIRALLDGQTVTSEPGAHYAFDGLAQWPPPIQRHVPIMIGGGGEKKTLRIVAKHADYWNVSGPPDELAHKREVLEAHCADVGRDPLEITRTSSIWTVVRNTTAAAKRAWAAQMANNGSDLMPHEGHRVFLGPPELVAERLLEHVDAGFETCIVEMAAPYDTETLDRLIGEVKPLVDHG